MIDLKDIITRISFYFDTKESYTRDDIYKLYDDFKLKLAKELQPQLDQHIKQEVDSATTKSLETAKAEMSTKMQQEQSRYNEQLYKLQADNSNLTKQLQEANDKLAPLTAESKKQTANELFKDLVVPGSEYDVFELLGDNLQKVSFTKEEDLKSKQRKVQPLLDELFKTKPYFKPASVNTSSNTQDNTILQTQIGNDNTKENKSEYKDYTFKEGVVLDDN